ncbi:hypothetical protein [Microbulbifer guangxiensis]|uniref:hypothetical protein n=1 Tax=Microbulbifer guangxiensis TaxID=2904249 RepID=UPI001F268668|nr:hypothetical protein [Microbulbifer guangxiensis]
MRVVLIVLLFSVSLISGCATFEGVEMSSQQLRDEIRKGEIIKPGDEIVVFTKKDGALALVVSEVNSVYIIGLESRVEIDDVVALQLREVAVGKSVAVVGGIVAVGAFIFLLNALNATVEI